MNKLQRYDELILQLNPDETAWDIEVDVLIVGAGGCGLVAALAAAEKGAQVFVVEKEKNPGGNTSLSQAMVPAASSNIQLNAGITDDSPELMAKDILEKNHYEGDQELTLNIARESASFINWLSETVKIDMKLVTDFLYPGHSAYRVHTNKSVKGSYLVNDLVNATKQYENLDMACNAPVKRLIVSKGSDVVIGGEVEIEGVGINLVRAKKVILALNGFGANREMLKTYIPEMADAYYFGHEANTGEGILWGKALGAKLDNMGAYQSHGSVSHPHGTLISWAVISLGGYPVNTAGKRFADQNQGYSEQALDVLAQEEGVAIEIFDQSIYDIVCEYEDFQQSIEIGAVKKFSSIEDLAKGFKLPIETLVQTHETFQKAASGQIEDPHGRKGLERPLMPPLYGVKVTGALFHTQGGLRINKKAEVIRNDSKCIPNLYAGGGTAVGFSGKSGPYGYLSCNGLLAALILGKIAGKEAAEEVLKENKS